MNKISKSDRRPEIAAALARLKDGNDRFATGLRSADSLASFSRMKDLAQNGQKPFVSVLACADSRVPAEMVFDCGLGELFVCRVAGSVSTAWMIASIEYAALALGAPLTVVMSHTKCGAVEAAVKRVEGVALGINSHHVKKLADSIAPAVRAVHRAHPEATPEQVLRLTWEENARLQMREVLAHSSVLRKLRRENRWDIVSAVYDLDTGRVKFERPAELAAQGARRKAVAA